MKTSHSSNRLDSSLVDREALNQLIAAFSKPGHVAVINGEGEETQLPEVLCEHLMNLVRLMREGQAIVMLPDRETFTTQAAANFLGMSRQFLVDLLEKGEIPHHRVGSHRRVYFKDLLDYQKKRDQERHIGLQRLRKQIGEAGLYDPGE